MRILVVEDDADLRRQLADVLSQSGYAVDLAADGEDGHFLGDTEPYDAAILDLGLPKMDGVSVLKTVARGWQGLPCADTDCPRFVEQRRWPASMPGPTTT
jgi:DNA-binding response OmpR family regulator